MADFHAVSRERHGNQYWRKYNSYAFAAEDVFCPLVAHEMPKAMQTLPIGFAVQGEHFFPVALQGLKAGENLLVAPDGRWLATYVPAPYRGHPFRMADSENGERVLCIDESSGLLSTESGEAIFDEDGKPAANILQFLQFFNSIDENRELTQRICNVLQRHELIQPWVITLKNERKVEGLFRIDEERLNKLSAEGLAEIHALGGMALVYCQLLSMQHVALLENLAAVKAEHEAIAQSPEGQNLGFMGQGGSFSFDSL